MREMTEAVGYLRLLLERVAPEKPAASDVCPNPKCRNGKVPRYDGGLTHCPNPVNCHICNGTGKRSPQSAPQSVDASTADEQRFHENNTTDDLRKAYEPFIEEDKALAEEGMAEYFKRLEAIDREGQSVDEAVAEFKKRALALLGGHAEEYTRRERCLDIALAPLAARLKTADAQVADLTTRIEAAGKIDVIEFHYPSTWERGFAAAESSMRRQFRTALRLDEDSK